LPNNLYHYLLKWNTTRVTPATHNTCVPLVHNHVAQLACQT